MTIESTLRIIKKIIPQPIFRMLGRPYHFMFSIIGAIKYGFPSKEIKIIGITGTKGKSSTAEIVNHILEKAGYTTAMAGTIRIKIAEESKPNKMKMTMPGRLFIHKFLRQAVDAKCDWVILEMTSQGVLQSRHKFIDLDALIFTNLSPEHIESHGSYEKYKTAKLEIAKRLSKDKNPHLILNGDDDESDEFILAAPYANQHFYSIQAAEPYVTDPEVSFRFNDATVYPQLEGLFNVYNMLGAATFAHTIGIDTATIKHSLETISVIPGRAQKTHVEMTPSNSFDVYVDYAHTTESLRALYTAFPIERKKICVLGNAGGGRDTWKRPEMAGLADKFCDQIILTDEDPYDEEPRKIVEQMVPGIKGTPYKIIMDRREAINYALKAAKNTDLVLITGKGTDPYIMRRNGEKEVWSDYNVVQEEIKKVQGK